MIIICCILIFFNITHFLLQHPKIMTYDCVMDLHNMKVVLMFNIQDNGVPSVTMAGTSMMPWLSVDNWATHLP